MAFHVGTDDPVEWIFARDLLAEGLDRVAGDGDVRVWPSTAAHRDVLNLALSSPFGQAHFEAPLTALDRFPAPDVRGRPGGPGGRVHADIEGELNDMLRWT